MLNMLFSIIIRPLELLFEIIYGYYGLFIIVLSLVVNLLLFPLYNRADAIQKEENNILAKMAGWITQENCAAKQCQQRYRITDYLRKTE